MTGTSRTGPAAPATVVTGATRGIGLALAHRFAAGGHDLLLVARTADDLQRAATDIRMQHGRRVEWVAADLAAQNAADVVEAALAGYGLYADVLVNNAGIGLSGAFVEHGAAEVQALVDLNVRALTTLTHRFLPGMRARRRGGVLNIASLGGYLPGPYQAAYYASKAYAISLTEALAAEVWSDGVAVTVVAPGPVRTGFHARMGAEASWYLKTFPLLTAERVARAAYRGFRWRQRVVVPGVANWVNFVAVRYLPHVFLVPLMAVLLRRR